MLQIWIKAHPLTLKEHTLAFNMYSYTFPKADRLLLMFAPSFNVAPEAPVLFTLSLPAKSTKFIYIYSISNNTLNLILLLTLANKFLVSSSGSF